MPFPEAERIIYRNNPLIEVVCQLRFPPILSIESKLPADFQDAIRGIYPSFQEKIDAQVKFPDELIEKFPIDLNIMLPTQGNRKNYEFISEDEKWKINLTRTFIALTTYKYSRWEEFINHFNPAFEALITIYSPAYFTRIGLRYKDLIDKSKLGLGDRPWSDLLQPQIAGILSDPNIYQYVEGSNNITEIKLADNQSMVRIRHGLANAEGHNDVCYLIDSDFFTDFKTDSNHAKERLDYFNQRGTRLIRWSITDILHEALEPDRL